MAIKQTDDRNRKVAWTVSITLHVLLLLAFIFMVAWREPNPPYPEFGIEVNFGTSSVGSGEVQPEPTETANETESQEEAQSEETTSEEVVEDIVEQIVKSVEETSVAQESDVVTQPNESPDVIEEKPKEEIDKIEEEKPEEEVEEEQVTEEKPQEVKTPVVFKKKDGADGEAGESSTPKNANHGDDTDAVGDKGNEEGTLDARTLYGNKGGGGGAPALNISGWFWDDIPNKKDASSENGIVEFSFVVDNEGYVGNITVIQSTVSPSVANFYKEQLRKTTFSQTNPNVVPLAQTKGTVKFIIKSR